MLLQLRSARPLVQVSSRQLPTSRISAWNRVTFLNRSTMSKCRYLAGRFPRCQILPLGHRRELQTASRSQAADHPGCAESRVVSVRYCVGNGCGRLWHSSRCRAHWEDDDGRPTDVALRAVVVGCAVGGLGSLAGLATRRVFRWRRYCSFVGSFDVCLRLWNARDQRWVRCSRICDNLAGDDGARDLLVGFGGHIPEAEDWPGWHAPAPTDDSSR